MDENTAAVAMLLAAAAQMVETPAAAPEKPISIDTLHDLHRQKAAVEQKLAEIEQKLQVMQAQLQSISEEKTDLVRRQQAIQTQAAKLCEVLFGIETRHEQPQPTSPVPAAVGSAAPSRKPDNSIVIDKSAPTPITATPQVSAEVNAVTRIPSLSL